METKEQTKLTDKELPIQVLEGEDSVVSSVKPFLLGIAGLAIVMGILVLLPMLFTYLSSGDTRAPSQIHAADPVGKSDQTIYKSAKPKK